MSRNVTGQYMKFSNLTIKCVPVLIQAKAHCARLRDWHTPQANEERQKKKGKGKRGFAA